MSIAKRRIRESRVSFAFAGSQGVQGLKEEGVGLAKDGRNEGLR